LRKQHLEGGLQAIAEMSPFYAGILADDPSQMPYYGLAQELDIPVGFHILPGGPNYGFHLMLESHLPDQEPDLKLPVLLPSQGFNNLLW